MTKEELAQQLDGLAYPDDPSRDLCRGAKASRLVIIYGASDDMIVFRGAIDDEVPAYDRSPAFIDAQGVLPARESIEDDAILEDFFQRRRTARTVNALWCAEGDYSWTFETSITHVTFEITEEGKPYCRGMVISLLELG